MALTPENATVGFIGTGVMGRSMARHLIHAGYPMHVYNRTKSKAAELLEAGASWAENPGAVAAKCNVIVTIVGYPRDVEEVYLGEEGLIARANAGSYLVDMTTSEPDLAVRIAEEAATKGVHALDAPVSGGDIGAREARLSIMVGGKPEAFEAVRPLFELMGKKVVLQGPAGSGQHTKMANQIAIAAGMVAVCEALAYARAAGLNPEGVLQSIGGGAAGSWSLSNLGPRMIQGNFDAGFYVKHFIKDMAIASDSAKRRGLETPGLALARRLYEQLRDMGGGELGTQALFKLFEK